ncbi:hypothetical protein [Alsobacter sp. R-9]
MKLALFGGAALMAALLTPLAVSVVGATARGPVLADLEVPVGAVQTMCAIERERGIADAAQAAPARPAPVVSEDASEGCARPVRVVGPTYGEPVLCRK